MFPRNQPRTVCSIRLYNPGSGSGGGGTVHTDGTTITGDGSVGTPIALLNAMTDNSSIQGAGTAASKIALKAVTTDASLTGAGIGGNALGMSPLTKWIHPTSTFGNTTATANQLSVFGFELPVPVTFANLSFVASVPDATHNCDYGLYNAAGTLLANIGAQHITVTGAQTIAAVQGSQTIPKGLYYIGFTSVAATVTFAGDNSHPCWFSNLSYAATSGGACPASITAPTPGYTIRIVSIGLS